MGLFIDKILKPIFLSKESNWIRRLDEMSTGQLDVAHNGDGDGIAFALALDGMVDIIENYDVILKSIDQFYIKFDIKTAKPIHKIHWNTLCNMKNNNLSFSASNSGLFKAIL